MPRPLDTRVLVITNVPAPYRLRLFERVYKEFAEFAVAFQMRDEPGRNWDRDPAMPFRMEFLPGFTIPLFGKRLRFNAGLKNLLEGYNPNVVVVGGFSPTAAAVACLCRKQGRRLVIMNDGTSSTDPLAGPEGYYRRWVLGQAVGFIAASGSARRYFLELGAHPDRVATVQLTTDLQEIRNQTSSMERRTRGRKRWDLGANVVCFVGQLVDRKRPLNVLEAFEIASRENEDLWLIMAGSGELDHTIRREIRRRGIRHVRLVGLLDWTDLLDLYAASDIHLFPSVREPYGMVIIESLAAGVPVIATRDSGAAADLIVEGENGHFVSPGDTESMAHLIREYFSSPARAESMRKAASSIVERHDIDLEANAFVAAIERAARASSIGSAGFTKAAGRGAGLVYATRTLAPYRVALFERLRELGVPIRILVAGSAVVGVTDATYEAQRRGLDVQRFACKTFRWRSDVIQACVRSAPAIVIIEHAAKLDFAWSLLLSRELRGVRRILWTHGIESRELYSRIPNLGTVGRWIQLRLCDGILCYDEEMAARMARSFPTKTVLAAPNSTDGRPLQMTRSTLVLRGKESVRRERGLTRSNYLAALGRLVPGKAFHRLPRIFELVRRSVPDTGLLLFGDGPERLRVLYEARRSGLELGRDVLLLADVRDPVELAKWLYCSDILINPGYVGLNAVDALFVGIPVALKRPGLTGPFHSPEWKYLRDSPGGFFATQNTDESLAKVIVDYLARPIEVRRGVEENCARYAAEHLGIEPMVRGILPLLSDNVARNGHTDSDTSRGGLFARGTERGR